MKKSVILITLMLSPQLLAAQSSDVQTALSQMKVNAENSDKNRESYEKNAGIAEQNLKTLNENISSLEKQKEQIRENAKKADQNVATMTKQETQIQELIKKENTEIDTEKKQTEALQQKMKQLSENIKKRQDNVGQYQAKMSKISSEKGEWLEQKKASQDLEKTIDDKTKLATTDRVEWQKKALAYNVEVKKWKAESDENLLALKKYEKLNK